MNSAAHRLASGLASGAALAVPCARPIDRVLVERLTACERHAERVAAIGDRWGALVGPEYFVIAWSVLSGLAQMGRARACQCGS